MGPPANMRSTSAGSDLDPESKPFFPPGVRQEAHAPIRSAYDEGDWQGTNSHAHPEHTQLSESMELMTNVASGHGDQTPSAASNTERIYVGYIVRQSPTSSATSRTRKAETSGGYELAEAQDSISAAAAGTLPNSEIDNNSSKGKSKESPLLMSIPESEIQENSQKGKSKEATPPITPPETTPPMPSGEDSEIHREAEKGKGKDKNKATETTHPIPHPGVDVRENSQEDRPSAATATTSNLKTIAVSDGDSIQTRKLSDIPGNETENEDDADGGSVGSVGEGVDGGDPSSSTRLTKKRRRKKKKSSQPTQKIEAAANEERSAKDEKAKEEEMNKRMNDCKSVNLVFLLTNISEK
jgi:hypothetical protein